MPIKLLDSGSFLGVTPAARAIRYAADNGAWIINNSWGPTAPEVTLPITLKDAIDHAVDNGRDGMGTAIFWSAGNSAQEGQSVDDDGWSSYERVITVGSINDDGGKSRYSETGEKLDLVAPSNDTASGHAAIVTTQTGEINLGNCQNRLYDTNFGGTSSASPLAAGVGGIVLSAVPKIRPEKLQAILEATASQDLLRPSWIPTQHGKGAVRMDRALEEVMTGPTLHALSYECIDQDLIVSVRDATASGSVEILAWSDMEPTGETATLQEVPGRPGLFEGTVPTGWSLTPSTGDGVLVIGPNQNITVEYGGIEDTATSTCDDSACAFDPDFDGLEWVEDAADCSGEGPTLHWTQPRDWGGGGPAFFNIHRSEEPDFVPDSTNWHAGAPAAATEWTDLFRLTPGTTYYYVVRAENDEDGCDGRAGGNQDDNSVILGGRAGADDAQGAVRRVTVRQTPANPGSLELAWEPVDGAFIYDVFRGVLPEGPFTFSPSCLAGDLDAAGAIPYLDSPPPTAGGRGYYYLVTVEGACGGSPFGEASSPRTDPPACP